MSLGPGNGLNAALINPESRNSDDDDKTEKDGPAERGECCRLANLTNKGI